MQTTGKFDLDAAWRDTTRLMAENRSLLAALGGIFFFLPYALLLVLLPSIAAMPALAPDADFTAAADAMAAFYDQVWWAFALLAIVVTVGTLAMLALLRHRERPTVGEAIGRGFQGLLPYLATLVAQWLMLVLVGGTLSLIAALSGLAALGLIGFAATLALQIYFTIRFSQVGPMLSIAGERSPLAAMRASWRLTATHAGRLFALFAMVAIAFLVVAIVVSLLSGTLLALVGDAAADFASALVSAGLMASGLTLFVCLLAACYAQLRRLAQRTPEG